MDDSAKNASSYQLDQEILEERGINMTVEEVAGLPTCKYSERVQAMNLTESDRAFLKGLRRRIKNRLASQNSRRRSVEHLRRLTRELRAVRACREDLLADRRALQARRDCVRDKCAVLRRHLVQILQSRSDSTEVPSIDVDFTQLPTNKPEVKSDPQISKQLLARTNPPAATHIAECYKVTIKEEFDDDDVYELVTEDMSDSEKEEIKDMTVNRTSTDPLNGVNDSNIFECKIGKLVQQSVNHIFNDKKKVFAKTVFISNDKLSSDESLSIDSSKDEVLNLCVKEVKRRSHGRKQSAPRRIAYCALEDDGVLDLKIKKENP